MESLRPDQRCHWLALARSHRVGPATFTRLLAKYGDVIAAYRALPQIAHTAKARGYAPHSLDSAQSELERGQQKGYVPLFLGHAPYPTLLAQCPNAPPFLWACGDLAHLNKPSVAIVGARNASSVGQRLAKTIATGLASAGYTVISGLARGIDQAAHHGALPDNTIAVLAGGIDYIYPQQNRDLYQQIAKSGIILSEQPLGMVPQARHFPQRNRIIAGLAKGVLVVEGAARSGSLITARDAADLGRDVMAIPGSPFDARASGCNQLIRDGACLIRNAQDVLDLLGTPNFITPMQTPQDQHCTTLQEPQAPPLRNQTTDAAQRILTALSHTAIGEDALIRDTGLSPTSIAQHITELELQGLIARHAGGQISLVG